MQRLHLSAVYLHRPAIKTRLAGTGHQQSLLDCHWRGLARQLLLIAQDRRVLIGREAAAHQAMVQLGAWLGLAGRGPLVVVLRCAGQAGLAAPVTTLRHLLVDVDCLVVRGQPLLVEALQRQEVDFLPVEGLVCGHGRSLWRLARGVLHRVFGQELLRLKSPVGRNFELLVH